MSDDRAADFAALLKAVTNEDAAPPAEPEAPASPFAIRVNEALRAAIAAMTKEGMIEIAEGATEALVADVTEAALETKSAKQLVKRVIHTLLENDHVEEIYGTDEDLSRFLTGFLGGD